MFGEKKSQVPESGVVLYFYSSLWEESVSVFNVVWTTLGK